MNKHKHQGPLRKLLLVVAAVAPLAVPVVARADDTYATFKTEPITFYTPSACAASAGAVVHKDRTITYSAASTCKLPKKAVVLCAVVVGGGKYSVHTRCNNNKPSMTTGASTFACDKGKDYVLNAQVLTGKFDPLQGQFGVLYGPTATMHCPK